MNSSSMASSRNSKGQFLPGTHWRKPAVFRAEAYLVSEYLVKQRSASEIASEHGVTENAVFHWLHRHGIKRRTIAEARAVKSWGADLSGPKNPMFGRKGHLNPRYVDGSSPERQSLYVQHEWKQLVASVYRRDGFKCLRCDHPHGSGRKLVAHHVRPWAGNPELRKNPANIVTLCDVCHRWVHSRRNADREWLA